MERMRSNGRVGVPWRGEQNGQRKGGLKLAHLRKKKQRTLI